MLSKIIGLLFILSLSMGAHAQIKVKLNFDSAGAREIWTADPGLFEEPTSSNPTEAKSLEQTLGEFAPGSHLFILDKKTGNVASKPMTEILGSWTVKPEEYRRVGRINIRIEHKGLPVAAAAVTLKDGKREMNQILDASAKTQGTVAFYSVEPGTIKVTVRYRTEGKSADPLVQSFELPLKRKDPSPTFTIAISDSVEVIKPQDSKTEKSDKPVPSDNPVGRIIVYLMGLAAAIGVGYFLLRFLQKNEKLVADKLGQIGVKVPDPQAPEPDPGPVAPMQPEPPKPIILDPVAPGDLVGSGGTPRLSGSKGTFDLAEGSAVVGREAGLSISLIGETTVSRRHAQLDRTGDSVTVTDLGSTNGTFINGSQVSSPTVLRPGDDVQFGQVRFRFEA